MHEVVVNLFFILTIFIFITENLSKILCKILLMF